MRGFVKVHYTMAALGFLDEFDGIREPCQQPPLTTRASTELLSTSDEALTSSPAHPSQPLSILLQQYSYSQAALPTETPMRRCDVGISSPSRDVPRYPSSSTELCFIDSAARLRRHHLHHGFSTDTYPHLLTKKKLLQTVRTAFKI